MATPMRRFHDMPFGAALSEQGVCRFRLWAPAAREVTLQLDAETIPMAQGEPGWWQGEAVTHAGAAYAYRIDGLHEVPDPAARMQADDVHGRSLVVDPRAFVWQDAAWQGRPWNEAVLYELHVGTFTQGGTFLSAIERLDDLVELGVTAVELMPVADFPGARDWGYDGVLLFAPDRRYGTPAQMKTFIDAAHQRGLMVLLDVVYNHFGPEGNYLHLYAPEFFTERHHTPWGAAINFDGQDSRAVRDFFIHNALYWLEEFHLDGLRFDAVHAVRDDSRPDILQELATVVRRCFTQRPIHLVLENDCNAAHYLRPGKGEFTAQWNDDFHHCMHVVTTGEESGYYLDFAHRAPELLARSLSDGFAFQGEESVYRDKARGEPSRDLPVTAFVNFLQNHDQIGNRAFGERLTVLTSPEALRAATVMLLLAPSPPLLFMGQEWASEQPFPFFCDFGPELAPKVSEGRRREFESFTAFADAAQRERIPDPQAPATADLATLRWDDASRQPGRAWRELHRQLLDLRKREIVPRLAGAIGTGARAAVFAENGIAARWRLGDGRVLLLIANLAPEPIADVTGPAAAALYTTPDAFAANGTLTGWSVVWYLLAEETAGVWVNGEAVLE